MSGKLRASILGGSGYAGGELLRILLQHPQVELMQVSSRKLAGLPVTNAHPNLRKRTHLKFCKPEELHSCEVLFLALPNGDSMNLVPALQEKAQVLIDMGADFRLRRQEDFEDWYGRKHTAAELLPQFFYGLSELHRNDLRSADRIACGGCEATATILALHPLVKHKLIRERILVDAKMSSSQAGREANSASHHPERAGAVRSYMPSGHRHSAEIRQELNLDESFEIAISATAIDMVRGLLVTIHTVPVPNISEKEIWKAYRAEYQDEPFIRIVKEAQGIYRYPEPKILAGTNFCDIGFELDKRSNRLVVIAALDNLVKGTAGQAVQAMNLRFGFSETEGLDFLGLHPV